MASDKPSKALLEAKAKWRLARSAFTRASAQYYRLVPFSQKRGRADDPRNPRAKETSTPKRRAMFKSGLKAIPRIESQTCYGCDRRVYLDADTGQRIGVRCLYCFRVYCMACGEQHFDSGSYFATIRLSSASIEKGVLAADDSTCRINKVRGHVVNKK